MHWPAPADRQRRAVILACDGIVLVRVTFMLLVLLTRRIPFGEALGVPLGFAAYYVGFALMTLRCRLPLDGWAGIGIVLFVAGSLLNSVSELQRWRWKRRPEHRGHLYTGGLFARAMHINYFGDVLWVAGFALVSGNPWAALLPVGLLAAFAFYNVPKLDRYLAHKYGAEFERYRRTTRRLVPFLY